MNFSHDFFPSKLQEVLSTCPDLLLGEDGKIPLGQNHVFEVGKTFGEFSKFGLSGSGDSPVAGWTPFQIAVIWIFLGRSTVATLGINDVVSASEKGISFGTSPLVPKFGFDG
jgi:hypothetical protein